MSLQMQQSAKPSAIHNEWCLWLCASIKQLCNQNRHTGDGGDNLNFPVRLAYIDWFIAAILVYDATDRDNDNRLTQTDANLNTTAFEYDALNRRTRIQYADTNDVTFSYDENGNRTGMIDANGLSFTFIVDALNRETEKQYPAPATPAGDAIQTIVNQYDANNNITNITETYAGTTGTRTTTQQFDAFDRLTEKTDANSERIRYSFDANGNRKTVRDPDGSVTHYTYDALNRVSDIAGQQGITNYRYDRSSLKTRVTYPNSSEARHTYDNAGRVLTIENRQNNAVVSSYEYRYDTNGNRTQQIETNGGAAETTDYSFDANDRLSEVAYPDQTTAYTYDAAYNRTQETTTEGTEVTEDKTYVYNNRNQVTEITDSVSSEQSEYAYDNNGNRLSKTVTPAAGSVVTTAFNYDVRDQLREILSGGSSVGQFLYDYQGLRIRKQTATETLRYVYDDQSVLLQTDDAGNTISKYDYGPDRLLSLTHNTEGAQFYLFDALGSVVNLTRTDGAIQARYQYDAWGHVRNQVGSSANEFGFTGHEMDEESGLIYMKARFYDPDLGQFLNQDAFEGVVDTPPSLHKYLYAAGNPIIYVDSDGNFFILGNMANELADLRNRTLDSAGSLSNRGASRGFQRVSAGFAGAGAGIFGILEGGVRTVNFLGNLAVDVAFDENSDNFFVKDAREQLSQTKAFVGQAIETVKEDHNAVGTAIVNSVVETGAGAIAGDPTAIAKSTATLSEILAGGGIAGASAKVAGQTLKAAGKGVNKVVDRVNDTAQKVTKKLIENATSGGPSSKLARQIGAVGSKVDSNKIVRGFSKATKANETRLKIVSEFKQFFKKIKESDGPIKNIKNIDPDSQFGFRGSTATGKVGNKTKIDAGKTEFDPDDFDVDIFVKSDKLFKGLGEKAKKPLPLDELRNQLFKQNPELFQGLRPGGKGVSIKVFPKDRDLGDFIPLE